MSPDTFATALEMIVFTLPAATMLGLVEASLIRWRRSDGLIDAIVIIVGGVGAATVLGAMPPAGSRLEGVTFGAVYGLVTAIVFVASERLLRTKQLSAS